MKELEAPEAQTFWEHLDVLRVCLFRIIVATVVCGVFVFFLKEEVFSIVLAPKSSDFITYHFLAWTTEWLSPQTAEAFSVQLVNITLAEQFILHLKISLYGGLLIASPYVIYELFSFIAPALYVNEKKLLSMVVGSSYIMFMLGALLSYFLIFPLTFRFLATYQLSADILNTIAIQSYIDTFITLNLMMGVVFEMPVLCWLLAKMGFLTAGFMKKYRKHGIILILVIAAIITPTSDIFTLLLVSFPMIVLYEVSRLIIRK